MAHFTEAEAIDVVPRLTQARLIHYIEARIVMPRVSERGYMFAPIDIARLALLCDLSDDLDLDETGLSVVISLLDQLHAARQDLHALASALQGESAEIRQRVGLAIVQPPQQSN